MILTLCLVNLPHHIYLQLFSCVRTLKIHSLSDFQIDSTMLLAIVTVLYITSPRPIYFITRNLNLSTPLTYFSYLFLSPSTITLSSISMRFFL